VIDEGYKIENERLILVQIQERDCQDGDCITTTKRRINGKMEVVKVEKS
jgi:hypothetical protein